MKNRKKKLGSFVSHWDIPFKFFGISGATSHSDRRTGLTNLAERVRTLMALAGHSQLAITQKYLDLRPSVVRAAIELV